MKNLLVIVLIVLYNFSDAQSVNTNNYNEIDVFLQQLLTGEKYNDPGEKYVNIYFKDKWVAGKVILKSGFEINNLILKYNCSANQIIALSDKFGLIKFDNQPISDFYLYDEKVTYHFKKIAMNLIDMDNALFYQVVHQGKTELYVYRRVRPNAISYTNKGEYHIYESKPIYILKVNDKKTLFRQASIKEIYNQLPYLKDKIRDQVKLLKHKIKSEEDFFNFLKQCEDIFVENIH